jgi:hypothetical protein
LSIPGGIPGGSLDEELRLDEEEQLDEEESKQFFRERS